MISDFDKCNALLGDRLWRIHTLRKEIEELREVAFWQRAQEYEAQIDKDWKQRKVNGVAFIAVCGLLAALSAIIAFVRLVSASPCR